MNCTVVRRWDKLHITFTLRIFRAGHNLLGAEDGALTVIGDDSDARLQHSHGGKGVAAAAWCWNTRDDNRVKSYCCAAQQSCNKSQFCKTCTTQCNLILSILIQVSIISTQVPLVWSILTTEDSAIFLCTLVCISASVVDSVAPLLQPIKTHWLTSIVRDQFLNMLSRNILGHRTEAVGPCSVV